MSKSKVRSPITWFGGKYYIADALISMMPKTKCYVEPFGGSAQVFFKKEPSAIEIYNDIFGEVVNFFKEINKDPEMFYISASSMPYSRQLYEELKWGEIPENNFERAVRWFYINRSNFSGERRTKSGWSSSKDKNCALSYQRGCELIKAAAERFKYVQIENVDFRRIFEVYDGPDTFFYCDPPYVGYESDYHGGFNEQCHRDLAEMLKNIKGKAMVSYYPDPLVYELYDERHWKIETIQTTQRCAACKSGAKRPRATELVIMNYDRPGEQMCIGGI